MWLCRLYKVGKAQDRMAILPGFMKKYWHKLAPLILDIFNESFNSGCFPQTLNQSSITLCLKKHKDPLACTSYHPISLLNIDFKLLTKLLVLHLKSILPSIISPDLTWFILNRYSFSIQFRMSPLLILWKPWFHWVQRTLSIDWSQINFFLL